MDSHAESRAGRSLVSAHSKTSSLNCLNRPLPGPSVGFPDLSRCDEVLDSELGWDCAGPSSR